MKASSYSDSHTRSVNRIAAELLSADTDSLRQSAAISELYTLCSSITGVTEDSKHPDDLRKTSTPWGQAISPKDAATCLLDVNRTVKFLRAIHAAILAAQVRFPNTTIEVLYAGCGPLAPFAILLTSQFKADQIQFTLLDLHQRSLDAAHSLFQTFGLGAFVRDYCLEDASAYQHGRPLHLIITETMQRALEKEPQVAITMNLAPQLCAGGILVPEKINVDACLCDIREEFPDPPDEPLPNRERIRLGRLLEVTAQGCRDMLTAGVDRQTVSNFPKVVLTLPHDLPTDLHLMLQTHITLFDSVELVEYESGLTHPVILYELGKLPGGAQVEFQYHVEKKPGFRYRRL